MARIKVTGFSPDDCFGDFILEAYLKKLRSEYERKSRGNTTARGFIDTVIRDPETGLLKLKLYDHLLRAPYRIQREYSTWKEDLDSVNERLMRQSDKLFDAWWKSEVERFEKEYPELNTRIEAIELYQRTHPEQQHLLRKLEDKFNLHAASLLQHLKTEKAEQERLAAATVSMSGTPDQEGSCSVESDTIESPRIRWLGDLSQLFYQFEAWHQHGLIAPLSYNQRKKLVQALFGDKDGTPYKEGSVRQTENNTLKNKGRGTAGVPRKARVIDEVTSTVKQHRAPK